MSNVIPFDPSATDGRAKSQLAEYRALVAATAAKPEPERSDSVLTWLGVNLHGEILKPAEIFKLAYGPDGVKQFWRVQFRAPMGFHQFFDVMAIMGAASDDDRKVREVALRAAVIEALHAGLPFVSLAESSPSITVHPLQAAIWLHGDKLRRHLVPRSLAALLPTQATQAPRTVATAARQPASPPVMATMPRGPRPEARQQVIEAMRTRISRGDVTARQLRGMTEQELADAYGVSRDTARKARLVVLSEFLK